MKNFVPGMLVSCVPTKKRAPITFASMFKSPSDWDSWIGVLNTNDVGIVIAIGETYNVVHNRPGFIDDLVTHTDTWVFIAVGNTLGWILSSNLFEIRS